MIARLPKPLVQAALIFVFAGLCGPIVSGQQEPKPHQETAPPPLRIVSRDERARLNETKDAKNRVKLAIEFAEIHLTSAESETTKQDYDKAAAAAGRYWALIDDAFVFLKTLKVEANKTRDLYKRVELTLRAHAPRLAAVRRSTPVEYAVWIKEIEELARNGRTEALNSFYGHTVVQEPRSSSKKSEPKPNP